MSGMGDKYVYVSSYGPSPLGPLWHLSINLQTHDFSESKPGEYDLDFWVVAETIEDAAILACAIKRGLDGS